MTTQEINDGINKKIRDTNDNLNTKMNDTNAFVDKSVEVRSNLKNKDLQKELKEFDSKYLNADEKEVIEKLNKMETESLGTSRYNAAKAALGGVKTAVSGPVGQAFGIMSTSSSSQKLASSEKQLHDISDSKDAIRSEAQSRQDKRYEQAKSTLPQVDGDDYSKAVDNNEFD